MRIIKLLLFSGLFPLAVATAYAETLCTTDEVVLFSCNTGRRIISLCGSMKPVGPASYIQYRYGRPNQLELVYPTDKKPPGQLFKTDFTTYARGSMESNVSFAVGEYSYTIYANIILGSSDDMNNAPPGEYGPHAGVLVYRHEKVLKDIACRSEDLTGDEATDLVTSRMAPYLAESMSVQK